MDAKKEMPMISMTNPLVRILGAAAFMIGMSAAKPIMAEEKAKPKLSNHEIVNKLYALNRLRNNIRGISDLTPYGPPEFQISTLQFFVNKLSDIHVSLNPRNAGVANPFIIGGVKAKVGEFPYEVGLLNAQTGGLFCGGAYLDRGWVVTAAHCIDDGTHPRLTQNDIIVFYGSTDLLSGGTRVQLASDPIVNSNWDPKTVQNDIALLKINPPDDLPYVRIPLDAVEAPVVSPGALLTVSGWGLTDPGGGISTDLMKADLPVVDISTCQSIYSSSPVSQNNVCAGQPGAGGCYGDSGGPLSGLDGEGRVLVGIVSFGKPSCDTSSPTVFTRVVKFRQWITDNTP
jgi:secreted trypsin-like serine protease